MKNPLVLIYCIEFYDEGPDAKGRRHFALTWKGTVPIMDGLREVGRREGIRGKHFYARPERFYPQGPQS